MNTSKKFTDLRVWQEAHQLALLVYKATKNFPKEEQFGLTAQVRRAAISVASNIAEGFNRFSLKEKIQFYSISLGSVSELDSQFLLAKDLRYLNEEEYIDIEQRIENIHKGLVALIKKIRS